MRWGVIDGLEQVIVCVSPKKTSYCDVMAFGHDVDGAQREFRRTIYAMSRRWFERDALLYSRPHFP